MPRNGTREAWTASVNTSSVQVTQCAKTANCDAACGPERTACYEGGAVDPPADNGGAMAPAGGEPAAPAGGAMAPAGGNNGT